MGRRLAMILAATALAAAPAAAQASTASKLSVASAQQARAGADVEGASELRGGFVIPLIAIVAIILGILAATGGDGDPPHSP